MFKTNSNAKDPDWKPILIKPCCHLNLWDKVNPCHWMDPSESKQVCRALTYNCNTTRSPCGLKMIAECLTAAMKALYLPSSHWDAAAIPNICSAPYQGNLWYQCGDRALLVMQLIQGLALVGWCGSRTEALWLKLWPPVLQTCYAMGLASKQIKITCTTSVDGSKKDGLGGVIVSVSHSYLWFHHLKHPHLSLCHLCHSPWNQDHQYLSSPPTRGRAPACPPRRLLWHIAMPIRTNGQKVRPILSDLNSLGNSLEKN